MGFPIAHCISLRSSLQWPTSMYSWAEVAEAKGLDRMPSSDGAEAEIKLNLTILPGMFSYQLRVTVCSSYCTIAVMHQDFTFFSFNYISSTEYSSYQLISI
jgi:hypothetical protein